MTTTLEDTAAGVAGDPTPAEVRHAAHKWHVEGYAAVPVRADGSKAPALKTWKNYSHSRTLPTDAEHEQWFGGQPLGAGLICGAVSKGLGGSKGLEMFELEGRAVDEGARERLVPALKNAGVFDVWLRLARGYAELAPAGGVHWLYLIADHDVPGNTKIAQRPARADELTADERALLEKHPNKVIVRCLAETRGEGGFVVVAPSHGTTHPTGRPWVLAKGSRYGVVPTITWEERNALHAVVRMVLDEMPEQVTPPRQTRLTAAPSDGERPGDAWARQTEWADILQPHGWRWIYQRGDMDFWTRPGKNIGVSARTGGQYDGLYVWSSSTEFPTEQSITKFRAYSILEHQGDDRAAGAELRRKGFGDKATLAERDRAAIRELAPAAGGGEHGRILAAVDGTAARVIQPAYEAPTAKPVPTNLPDAFWDARGSLRHIRQAAHAFGRSADAVFGNVLARLGAMAGHELRFNFGLGPGSLNMFVAVVGPSGTGKSAAHALAEHLMNVPDYLQGPNAFRDGIGLGSGEGMAEAYMGIVTVQTDDVKMTGTNAGKPKTKQVRAQIRHNALFYVDEGETLTRQIERQGTTIGPAIRTAWVGGTLGQANAREETTRMLPAGEYSMGMVIGYQKSTAQPLLADVGPGTPQRFLWLTATDPSVPDVPSEWPGHLTVQLESVPMEPLKHVIGCDEQIRTELWQRNLARVRGEVVDNDLDSHVPYMRSKLACLLAILDGRLRVTLDDWELSRVIWETSCAVRDGLVDYGKQEAFKAQEQRTAAYVEREERAQLARAEVPEKVERIARRIARRVHENGSSTRGDAYRQSAGRDRPFVDAAVNHAINRGWLLPDGEKVLGPGSERPA